MTPIYMDNHASTPVDPEVLDVFVEVTRAYPGNPSSTDHVHGSEAHTRLEEARATLADALDAQPREVVFTSGSTESNNLAIRGAVEARVEQGRHVVTSLAEHPSVLETCHQLEREGWRVTYVDVDAAGRVLPEAVERAMTAETVLVSVMAANNEIGTINDVASIARVVHGRGALFHCDATQAIGMCSIGFESDTIDLMSVSGHKIYAPRGIGALLVRRSGHRVKIHPIIHGGGHERGLRPGTVNVAGAAALAEAAAKAVRIRTTESSRISGLRDRMWALLADGIDEVAQNGDLESRLPGNLSVFVPGVEAKALVAAVRKVISVSAGSACSTEHVEPSHVLLAMGQAPERAFETIRIGVGRFNTEDDIERAAASLVAGAESLRSLSAR